MEQPSTGLDPLDELLGGLGVGDNVVWQATNPADTEPFVHALLATARGITPHWSSARISLAPLWRLSSRWPLSCRSTKVRCLAAQNQPHSHTTR
jgi:hypothetical protein